MDMFIVINVRRRSSGRANVVLSKESLKYSTLCDECIWVKHQAQQRHFTTLMNGQGYTKLFTPDKSPASNSHPYTSVSMLTPTLSQTTL